MEQDDSEIAQRPDTFNPQNIVPTHVLDLTVRLKELAQVDLGGLEELGLSDVDVLEGEDSLGGLLDLSSDRLGDELLDQLLQLALALPLHDLVHLGPDLPDLGGLSVRGLLDLLPVLSGESDGEKSDEVSIGGSDIDVGLDQGLPLSDQRSDLVGGEVHAVERSQTVLVLLIRKRKRRAGRPVRRRVQKRPHSPMQFLNAP